MTEMSGVHLSAIRTHMANRRTLMAAVRTTLAFVGLAVVLWKAHALGGVASAVLGVTVLAIGIYLYGREGRAVQKVVQKAEAVRKGQ